MYTALIFVISLAAASPEPCEKFDGAEYDKCVDNLIADKNVELKDEDLKNTGEEQCRQYRTDAGIKSCLEESKKKAYRNAKERIQQEQQGVAVKKYNEARARCEVQAAISRCDGAHNQAQQALADLTDSNMASVDRAGAMINSCISACSTTTPSVDAMILGCAESQKNDVRRALSAKHKTCKTPGGRAKRNDSDVVGGQADDNGKRFYTNYDDEETLKDMRSNPKAYGPSCGHSSCTAIAELSKGVKVQYEVAYSAGQGYTRESYLDSQGNEFDTYSEAAASNERLRAEGPRGGVVPPSSSPPANPPIPSPRPDNPPNVARDIPKTPDTTNKTQTTGADNGRETGATSSGSTNSSSTNKQDVQAASNGESNSGRSSGGSGSGTGGGNGATFNPAGNFNLNPSEGNNSGGSSNGFQGTATQSISNNFSDAVGGTGDSGGSWSENPVGSFQGTSTRDSRLSSNSEGVNRSAPISMASMGSGVAASPVVAASHKQEARDRGNGDMNSPAFQMGHHKAPPLVEKMSRAQVSALKEKIRRLGKNAKATGCRYNDLQCFANFFHKQNLKMMLAKNKKAIFQQRGIASVPGQLPKGVWRGYVDILSHMSKVHDRIDLNFEGEIEAGAE